MILHNPASSFLGSLVPDWVAGFSICIKRRALAVDGVAEGRREWAQPWLVGGGLPRSPEYKGKVERSILDYQSSSEVPRRHWDSWEHFQQHADTMDHELSRRRLCPATGTSVLETWRRERSYLSPVPLFPEPFDLMTTRRVQLDCTVGFEGRRYSVPFELVEWMVEVRGCARTV